MPWNDELYKYDGVTRNKYNEKYFKSLAWAEKEYTIGEVGSTFTIQGFDLAYAGVILGPSVRYDNDKNKIWFEEIKRAWGDVKGKRILRDGVPMNVTNILSQHELRVLMTRATQGLYIYACDDELRKALKKSVK